MVNSVNLVALVVLLMLGLGLLASRHITEGCIFIAAELVVLGLTE
jgi:hypothetical protein